MHRKTQPCDYKYNWSWGKCNILEEMKMSALILIPCIFGANSGAWIMVEQCFGTASIVIQIKAVCCILHKLMFKSCLQDGKSWSANCVSIFWQFVLLPHLHNSFSEPGATTMQCVHTNSAVSIIEFPLPRLNGPSIIAPP